MRIFTCFKVHELAFTAVTQFLNAHFCIGVGVISIYSDILSNIFSLISE